MHTGTGRISKMPMYPMSLYESKESTGTISLRLLFDDPTYDIDGLQSDMTVEKLIFAACRGGWPASLDVTSQEAQLLIAQDYVNVICDEDISRVDGVQLWLDSSCVLMPGTSAPSSRNPRCWQTSR